MINKIKKSGYDVSMLLISNNANYYKKATGLIVFNCNENAGQSVDHIHMHLLGGRKFKWPPG